jgi:DNA-binding transcriptional ArsR family regulator
MAAVCPEQDDERIYRMLKALGNPVRLQIVRLVHRRPRCIGNEILLHLPDEMARAQSTLSQHLKILCDAGLIEAECDGPATCYAINQERLDWLREQLADL